MAMNGLKDKVCQVFVEKLTLWQVAALLNGLLFVSLSLAYVFTHGAKLASESSFAIGTVLVILLVAVLVYVGLFLNAKANTGLKDAGAVVVAVCFLELVAGGAWVNHAFSYQHIEQKEAQTERIFGFASERNKTLPQKINELITLVQVIPAAPELLFYYDIKERPGFSWERDTMRTQLKDQSCGYMADKVLYGDVNRITHIFMQGSVKKFTITFAEGECHAPPTMGKRGSPIRGGVVRLAEPDKKQ